MKEKVGVAIVTCDRPDFLRELTDSLNNCNNIDELVVVNDGAPIIDFNLSKGILLNNPGNLGVGKTKNRGMQYLLDKGCDYIFVLEDDILIRDPKVFEQYITSSKVTGIQHFNFGPGTPFNKVQTIENFDLHNRNQLSNSSKPNPRLIIDYRDLQIALYQHCAGLLSFFTRDILLEVGLNDERFYNAWEHVEHTYRIILAKGHPPFWWFADIHDSTKYLDVQSNAIEKSCTSKNKEEWFENIYKGREIYKNKHGFYPNMGPQSSQQDVISSLKSIKAKWTT